MIGLIEGRSGSMATASFIGIGTCSYSPGAENECIINDPYAQEGPSSGSIPKMIHPPKRVNLKKDNTGCPSEEELNKNLLPYLEEAVKSDDRMRAIGIILSEIINFLDRSTDSLIEPILNVYERFITIFGQGADTYSRTSGMVNININEEKEYLHDIDDIRAELAMIKRVVLQQQEVWKDFVSNTWWRY